MGTLDSVCAIARWSIVSEEGKRDFLQKLSAIFTTAEELRVVIGEKIASVEIRLMVILPDQPFIRELMQDAYEATESPDGRTKGHPPPQEIVLGTVGFGLKHGSKYYCVQPAKVALVSTLEALAPPPPPAAKPRSASTRKVGSTTPAQAKFDENASPGRSTGTSGTDAGRSVTNTGAVTKGSSTATGQEKKWWQI